MLSAINHISHLDTRILNQQSAASSGLPEDKGYDPKTLPRMFHQRFEAEKISPEDFHFDTQTKKFTKRTTGTQKAIHKYLDFLRNSQKAQYDFCLAQAKILTQKSPLTEKPNALVCISAHQDENLIEKLLPSLIKSGHNPKQYPIYIFINGDNEQKIIEQEKRCRRFAAKHQDQINLQIITAKHDFWRNGLKSICPNIALMHLILSGHLMESDSDIPIVFHDADMVQMPKGLWDKYKNKIDEGTALIKGFWQDDLNQPKNPNHKILAGIYNIFDVQFAHSLEHSQFKKNICDYAPGMIFAGANHAISTILYCKALGIKTAFDHEEISLTYPAIRLLNKLLKQTGNHPNLGSTKPLMETGLLETDNHSLVKLDGEAIMRSVNAEAPVINCMSLHSANSSASKEFAKSDFTKENLVNVHRIEREIVVALEKILKAIPPPKAGFIPDSKSVNELAQFINNQIIKKYNRMIMDICKTNKFKFNTGFRPLLKLSLKPHNVPGQQRISISLGSKKIFEIYFNKKELKVDENRSDFIEQFMIRIKNIWEIKYSK